MTTISQTGNISTFFRMIYAPLSWIFKISKF